MQEKVVFDTNIYIGIFNRGLYQQEIARFNKVVFLVHPLLHELWMGARGKAEVLHLVRFGNAFITLGRLVQPEPATQVMIGRVCRKLRFLGKLEGSDHTGGLVTLKEPLSLLTQHRLQAPASGQ